MNSGYNHLTQAHENKWIFYANGDSWQVWDKPDGCNMIHIVAIGAGGGGGGGYQRVSTANGGGGGGGASTGINTMMIPAYTIPDKLYILVGTGGAGGANLAAGSSPNPYYITLIPFLNTFANSFISQGITGGGGGAGSATGGAGGSAVVTQISTFSGYGRLVQIVGNQAGQAGTTPSVNFDQTRLVGGGAGGAFAAASTNVAGRSVTSSYKQPSSVVYSQGAAISLKGKAGNGPNLISPQPEFFGGASGDAYLTSNGSNGGDGGIGCGGGGAGVGVLGANVGGRGGDGLVIITCW